MTIEQGLSVYFMAIIVLYTLYVIPMRYKLILIIAGVVLYCMTAETNNIKVFIDSLTHDYTLKAY